MKKLFEKNEVTFAVILIVIYVVGASIMQSVSESIGIKYLADMVFNIAIAVAVFCFIKKNGLEEHIGLCRPEVSSARMLFYIPVLLAASLSFFFGIGAQYPAAELVFRTISMLFVGFLEEVIFRGFLFKGICKVNVTRAIVISSVTFGIGHIVNLRNGQNTFDTLVQIVFAVAVGFMLVFVFYRTGSLLPCIAFHSLNNCLTGFYSLEDKTSVNMELILISVRIFIAVAYTVYIIKYIPKKDLK